MLVLPAVFSKVKLLFCSTQIEKIDQSGEPLQIAHEMTPAASSGCEPFM